MKTLSDCTNLLKKYTKHEYVKLTSRGNSSIFCALAIIKKLNPKPFVLIPESSGWISFIKYPKIFNFGVKYIKCNDGLIDIADLQKNVDKAAAVLITNPAGYFAEQNLKKIYSICKDKSFLILDASGSIGSEMCNGLYADIIVGSFGHYKPVDLGFGGFISVPDPNYFKLANVALSTTKFPPFYDELYEKLINVNEKYSNYYSQVDKIKSDLKDMDIINPKKSGLNVVVGFKSQDEKEKIIKYCHDHNYQFRECPDYIRLVKDAISIEVKRGVTNGRTDIDG